MPQTGINERYFNSLIRIERRTTSTNDIGDLVEDWHDLYGNDIPARLQPVRYSRYLQYRNEDQGRESNVDKECFIPSDLINVVEPGDRVVTAQNEKLLVLWSELYDCANKLVMIGNHQKLYLQLIRTPKS